MVSCFLLKRKEANITFRQLFLTIEGDDEFLVQVLAADDDEFTIENDEFK